MQRSLGSYGIFVSVYSSNFTFLKLRCTISRGWLARRILVLHLPVFWFGATTVWPRDSGRVGEPRSCKIGETQLHRLGRTVRFDAFERNHWLNAE